MQTAEWFFPSLKSRRLRSRKRLISPASIWISTSPINFYPNFRQPIYLTTRPDLGDVSQRKLVTIENYYELFNGILNPKSPEIRGKMRERHSMIRAVKNQQ
jgi:hypothetical protein